MQLQCGCTNCGTHGGIPGSCTSINNLIARRLSAASASNEAPRYVRPLACTLAHPNGAVSPGAAAADNLPEVNEVALVKARPTAVGYASK
jgi:hypothetical protein